MFKFSHFLSVLPMLSLLLTCPTVFAASTAPGPTEQVKKIQNLYRELTSLSFDFSQITRTGNRNREGRGNAVFYRPGGNKPIVMRWNYSEPDPQVILNDGKTLSIYTQKDRQLIVTSSEELQSDITSAFFSGTRNLLEDFTPLPPDNRFVFRANEQEIQAVQLIPRKPHAQIKTIHLWFDDNFVIRHLVLEDYFDSITELTFSNIKRNALPVHSAETLASIVQLDLPPDIEIIHQ